MAELEFYDPATAPADILGAARMAFLDQQIVWLIRVRCRSSIGEYLATSCRELLSTHERTRVIKLGNGDSLHVGLASTTLASRAS